jgi:hypothetical protein
MALKVGPQEVVANTGYWVGNPYGLKGADGTKGEPGGIGAKGGPGEDGAGGAKGQPGEDAEQGAKGLVGEKGGPGATGEDGVVISGASWVETAEVTAGGENGISDSSELACDNGILSIGLIKNSLLYYSGTVQGQCYCIMQDDGSMRVQAVVAGTGSGQQKCQCGVVCK